MKEKESNKLKNYEVSSFSRKLNVLFCYYNELGDEFSFVNSDKKEENKNWRWYKYYNFYKYSFYGKNLSW